MTKPQKLVICLVGLPGAGKSTIAKIIKKNFSASVFETGDVIREEIKRRGLRYTKENDENVSRWFHAGRERLIIRRTASKMKASGSGIAVVSGFFAPEEYRMLSGTGMTVLIAIVADFRKRYMRELLRKRFASQTEKYLRERDRRELGEGLGKLLKAADYRIINVSGKRELEKKVVALVRKILETRGQQA